jgi:hypothetical protein
MVAARYAALRVSPIPSRDHRERYGANFRNLALRQTLGKTGVPRRYLIGKNIHPQ